MWLSCAILYVTAEALIQRFPEGWPEAKSAINQLGLDTKKKDK